MVHRLKTAEGKKKYASRKFLVGPIIEDINSFIGFRRLIFFALKND